MSSGFMGQLLPLVLWFESVNRAVTEPYLDEVFHVRQAQSYLKGRFDVWDDKITTPPGTYLLSYAASPLLGNSLKSLRTLSLFCHATISPILLSTYARRQTARQHNAFARHSAFNMSLLPPLFFFSALYYTDVASTLSVVLFYWHFLRCYSNAANWIYHPILIIIGLISLSLRQTNIFWVAIFPAGLVLINQIDRGHAIVKDSMHRRVEGFGDSVLNVAKTTWKMDVVFDPSVRDAWFEDYIKTLISVITGLSKMLTEPKRCFALVLALSPYLTILSAFAVFIVWNGSVVMGDKSNHIATIHLPQMLYIWPYFIFFSWPIVYPYLSALAFGFIATLSRFAPLESMLIFKRRRLVPRLTVILAFVGLAGLMVRFNTVVHPFLLADNRHYMFYMFRLLMRRWWVKYAVVPIYVVCGWACVQALGSRPSSLPRKEPPKNTVHDSPLALPDGNTSATTTFAIVWLATTTLQLVTAPLVEPRYLILPWIFWRMHVPLQQYRPVETPGLNKASGLTALDHRLWFETAWFLFLNAVTGYIFIKWGFEWPQEPGNIQRFMW